ncbi:hypothetical protein M3Y99_00648700 [Aphelenchoides fujianensis]|nr:hypothetical protein M3Y99_00648700 [Aphelenchoides fujianensis]
MAASSSSVQPVVDLAQKYRSEFEQQYEGLRQRSVQLSERAKERLQQLQEQAKELQPLAQQKKDELAQIVVDQVRSGSVGPVALPLHSLSLTTYSLQSPIEGVQAGRVLETFAWTAVLQLTYAAVATGTGIALAPLVGLVLDGLPAFALAYGLLPYLAYRHVQQPGADDTARFKLLAFAAVEGLLVGFLMADRYLTTFGPLSFLTPLAIGVGAQLTEGKLGPSRQAFLGATVGSGLGLHLVLGLLGGQLSFAYLLLALAYSAVGLVTLQLYLKYQLADQSAPTHLYQLGFFLGALGAQAVVYGLFGGSYEDQKAAAQQSSQ